MESNHKQLLRSILEGGPIPLNDTVESQRLMGELVDTGLIEIAHPGGQHPGGRPLSPEYRLTPKGRAIAEWLTQE